jgi:hypothetical protein
VRFKRVFLLTGGAAFGVFALAIVLNPSQEKAVTSKKIDIPFLSVSHPNISSEKTYSDEKPRFNSSNNIAHIGFEEDQCLPIEWEEPFLDVMTKDGQSMDERNSRLIDLVTKTAVGVPQVQDECMRHLAYGLRSDQKSEFYDLVTNTKIPKEIRKRFLGWVFDMGRSDEFIAWLCNSLRTHGDAEIISFTKERIQNVEEL